VKTCPVCSSEWPDDTRFCPKDGSTLRVAEGADLIGSIVADRYHIEKKLGEGGMGAVYLAEHVKMGRRSAIKVMTQSMASDPEAIARFNREAANAARINHPNVCAIYDFGETEDGTIYLAMEFIEGESLSDTLRREGAIDLDRAAEILRQAGEALQAAHDLGIVHRDLKPDNIMVAKGRDGADVVKVVDFGIAKAMTGEEGQKVTRTGLVVGTPEYMSPEQLSGDVLNGRSDIYSLALVFFRMVTGALPFQAESSQETMIKRLTDDPLKLSEVAPDAGWPPRLQGVMDRALERMPADRYESAALFARDTLDAVRGAGRPVVGVDTEGATEVIGAGGVTEQLPNTRVSGGPEETTPQTPVPATSAPALRTRKKPVAAIAVAAVVVVVGGGIGVTMMGRGGNNGGAAVEPAEAIDSARLVQSETGQPGGAELETESGSDAPQQGPGRQPAGQDRAVTTPVEAEAQEPPLDTLALRMELDALFFEDVEDAARRPAARQRAQQIYEDPRAPAELRAQAAGVMGQAYWVEERMTEACRWFRLADQLDPNNRAYTTPLTTVCAS
jgi:serine/threonine-protein kinase